ncbi:hypothetical protein THAOC_13656 [Thalassiosira oceanica]|uniref:Uncharacterized protein n=1 Tax=Thalassiosira oceanica TaxID=159749 RepID=K0SWV4_THAOC|nr:hypothetical protein THAOC_13656 [Thalassiosira oceanica]|eukprot:EJK65476.1 hypothetical protein THAOC_13656 [Thalassiosira oceanica]
MLKNGATAEFLGIAKAFKFLPLPIKKGGRVEAPYPYGPHHKYASTTAPMEGAGRSAEEDRHYGELALPGLLWAPSNNCKHRNGVRMHQNQNWLIDWLTMALEQYYRKTNPDHSRKRFGNDLTLAEEAGEVNGFVGWWSAQSASGLLDFIHDIDFGLKLSG